MFLEEGWDFSLKRKSRPEWTRDRGGPRWNHSATFLPTEWHFTETPHPSCGGSQGGWDSRYRVVSAKLRPNETEQRAPESFYNPLVRPDVGQCLKRMCEFPMPAV